MVGGEVVSGGVMAVVGVSGNDGLSVAKGLGVEVEIIEVAVIVGVTIGV